MSDKASRAGGGQRAVVERLVAAEDLAAGTRLDESHLQRRQVPAAWAPRASLDPLAAQALLGAVLSADIDAGEIILPAHLLGQPAGRGVDGACGWHCQQECAP